jgi:hypothetical protein
MYKLPHILINMGAEDEGRFHDSNINQHRQDLSTDMHVIVNVGTEIQIGK